METGSLADLAAMMGLSSVNVTDKLKRERRSSNRSDGSNASSVNVSLALSGDLVQVTLDTSEFRDAEAEQPPAL